MADRDLANGKARKITEFIDLKSQYRQLQPEIDARMNAVLEHGQYILGPEVSELEQAIACFVGVEHCIGVSDGTTALQVALMALGIGPGDEVITTPFTFIATGEVISLLGATPVFTDIDPLTYNLDPSAIEAAISDRTRAIIAVSLFGQCADMARINEIASRHGLPVIEDAAQSFGATHHGRRSGGLSTIACTSFFPSKPLGCFGDGGACMTNDADLAEAMRQIRVHGQSRRYEHTRLGLNGRLDTLQAAVLLVKLAAFPDNLAQRTKAAKHYLDLLGACGCDDIVAPVVAPGNTSVFAQFTVRVPRRSQVIDSMSSLGVPTAIHYPKCLHQQSMYRSVHCRATPLPAAEAAAQQVLSLPFYPGIEPAIQEQVIDCLAQSVTRAAVASA